MQVTIHRHAVFNRDNGLSPLQNDLLSHPSKIRITAAPTGAGKSYAFHKAILGGQRILFIVPTRRLAQNLLHSLREFLEKQAWEKANKDSRSDDDLVTSWCEILQNKSGVGATAWRKHPQAMVAAEALTQLTRLVLLDEAGEEWETTHGIIG